MEQLVQSKSSTHRADNYLTSKQYQRAIDEYRVVEDQTSDPSLTKLIKNRILHCKFMIKGILDCRKDGIGIYYKEAEITLHEALQIIAEVKLMTHQKDAINYLKSKGGSIKLSRGLGKSLTFAKTVYDGMDLSELEELKYKFNQEKNKTEARKVRVAIRKLK